MSKTFNINEFAPAVDNLFQKIASGIPDINQIIAKDAIALIKNRLQEKGQTAENASFPAYSPAYKKRKAKQNGEESTSFRNFTLTGDMLRQLNIVSTGTENGQYTVTIGGKAALAQDKIDWNSEQVGDILEVSKDEQELFQQTLDDELQKIIDEAGFGK
jgi:hypothetical protein